MDIPHERWRRIIPVAFVMYTIAFINRTNLSLALPDISRDLHMDAAQAGDAAGIFFWGYILLQVPGGYIAQRWSAKRFVSVLLVLWGGTSIACGLVTSWRELWGLRFLLGVVQGGVWPATLVLLAHWFPRAERARANAYWMLCLPVAMVISSPISGWILSHYNWRVMLMAEGALPFLWLLVWHRLISDYPQQARWISAGERDHLESTLQQEKALLASPKPEPYRRALTRPQVLLMVAIYFLANIGCYGFLFWLPTILDSARKFKPFWVGVLFAVPFVVTGIGMVVNSRHSDRTQERRRHVAVAYGGAGLALLAAVAAGQEHFLLAYAFITLASGGMYGALGPFWGIPTETLPPHLAGSAMGMINALGNLGGYFGPLVVG